MSRKRTKVSKDHRVKGGKEKLATLGKKQGGILDNYTYKDTKKLAITLGMPFPDVVNSDWGDLQSFILKTENKPNKELIHQFDDWMDEQLVLSGYEKNSPVRSYMLRLGYVSEERQEEMQKNKANKVKKEKEKKPKKEKDERGLWKGTKKSYTYELTARGYELERIQKRVIKKFPDANLKSIQQWMRAAQRKLGNQNP